MRTLGFLLEKEFKQFLRDPFLPRMIVIFPVIIMLIIPLVANFDFKNINIARCNHFNFVTSCMTSKIIGRFLD